MENLPSLRDFLIIIFKYKYRVFLLFAFIVSTITTFTYVWPFTYEASAKILVKFERNSVSLSSAFQSSKSTMTMKNAQEIILSEKEILINRYLIEKLVKHLWDDLTRVGVETPTSLWEKTKVLFKKIINRIRETLYKIGYYFGLIQKLGPFVTQVSIVQGNLKIEAIKRSNIIQIKYRSWNPELAAKVVNTLTDLYLEHHITVHKVPRAHNFFQKQTELLKTKLKKQENKLSEFKQKWKLSSIEVERTLLMENISRLMLENKNLNSKLQEKQLKYYRSRISTLDEKEIKLHRMERELNILEESYKRYLSRLEDTRISEALDLAYISNVSVIEPALIPFSPVRKIPYIPRRIFHIILGIFIGMIVSIGYAFMANYFDHTLKNRKDIKNVLDATCFASIPHEK